MTTANRGRNSSTSWLRKSTRFAILFRDDWRCVYCAKNLDVGSATIDHLRPTSRGGSHHPTNLVAACLRCNSRRQDRPLRTFLRSVIAEYDERVARQIERAARRALPRDDGRRLARFYRALRSVA